MKFNTVLKVSLKTINDSEKTTIIRISYQKILILKFSNLIVYIGPKDTFNPAKGFLKFFLVKFLWKNSYAQIQINEMSHCSGAK